MASDLISRSALLEDAKKHFDVVYGDDGRLLYSDHICNGEDVEDLIDFIKRQPTVDAVEVREARWKGEGFGDYSCSLCGEIVTGNSYNYCPHCGAKMDGGDKE